MRIPNPFGWRIPKVSLDEYSAILSAILAEMIPAIDIYRAAGITPDTENWEESTAAEAEATRDHLITRWQPAHNALNAVKLREHGGLHRAVMLASRAYGETLSTYVEYLRALVNGPYEIVERARRDGGEWDQLSREYAGKLVSRLDDLADGNPQAMRMLLPGGIPDTLAAIADESRHGGVATFGLSTFEPDMPGTTKRSNQ